MHNTLNEHIGRRVTTFIDIFYPPFRTFFKPQVFHYAVCGASNTVFSWILYWFLFHFIFDERNFTLLMVTFTPHVAALFTQLPITFLTGFWLSRYVSFSESKLTGGTQIFRYLLTVICSIVINYAGIKFFVEICGIYPTPSQMLNTLITIVFSFFVQKKFTFKA